MKKAIIISLSAFFILSCEKPNNAGQKTGINHEKTEDNSQSENLSTAKTPVNIIGKKATITYPDFVAEVEYISPTKVRWKTTDIDGNTLEETSTAGIKQISDTQFLVHWVEDDGTAVSQLIDTEKGSASVLLSIYNEGEETYNEGNGIEIRSIEGEFSLNP